MKRRHELLACFRLDALPHFIVDAINDLTDPLGLFPARFRQEIHVQAVVQIGDPAQNIVQYSEEHPTDLIIIGNRGLSGLKKILLGSVSNYVLLRSQVPILIMK